MFKIFFQFMTFNSYCNVCFDVCLSDPVNKSGVRGPPVLLKRPKDLTVLKIQKNYQTKIEPKDRPARSNSTLRRVKNPKGVLKEREKLVCPICGILTFSLGNHIATHEGINPISPVHLISLMFLCSVRL